MKWRALRIATLAAALGLMIVLVARLGPRAIGEQLASAGPGALWLLVVYLAGVAINGLPWRALMDPSARPSRLHAVTSRIAAAGANSIMPLLGFGGEPVRLLWLSSDHRAAGVAAIVLDRVLYAAASAVFLLGGVVALLQMTSFPASFAVAGAIAVLALTGASVFAGWLVVRKKIAARIHNIVRRLRRQTDLPLGGFGEDVDTKIEEMVQSRRVLLGALGTHVLGRVVLGAEVVVGFAILGVPLAWDQALVFASVPVLLAFIASVVPSQIAIQEGTQALVATALGLEPTVAVAVVLLQRIRQVVSGAIAWALIAMRR
jgi:hypothetical protein